MMFLSSEKVKLPLSFTSVGLGVLFSVTEHPSRFCNPAGKRTCERLLTAKSRCRERHLCTKCDCHTGRQAELVSD